MLKYVEIDSHELTRTHLDSMFSEPVNDKPESLSGHHLTSGQIIFILTQLQKGANGPT